jgi:23S rRNA-intervening sequence protein
MAPARHYTDLIVWQLAEQIRIEVFKLTPKSGFATDFTAREQAEDSIDSTCRNIAEGFGCETHAEFARFLEISRRSDNSRGVSTPRSAASSPISSALPTIGPTGVSHRKRLANAPAKIRIAPTNVRKIAPTSEERLAPTIARKIAPTIVREIAPTNEGRIAPNDSAIAPPNR